MLAYALTIFLSAFLLFQVELIIGKELLPWFGGTPSVWTTCLVFFQIVLLAGYVYAHVVIKRFRMRMQLAVHLLVLGIAFIILAILGMNWPSPITPDAGWKPTGGVEPTGQLLALLAVSVGLPFFVLSTTGPLLQAWFVSVYSGKSPYRLYALSNVGSLLGLLSYPFVVEPYLTIREQAFTWSAAYALFTVGVCVCASGLKKSTTRMPAKVVTHGVDDRGPAPGTKDFLFWTALAAAASGLLLSTTNHMCQDTAIIPLLWVLPLVLYLITFILCFEYENLCKRWLFPPLFGVSLALAVVILYVGVKTPLLAQIGADAAVLFTGCMVCHGELSKAKPGSAHLTMFYLAVALGGALGGLSVAIVAPRIFEGFWEFHITLFAAGALFLVAIIRDSASFLFKKTLIIGPAIGGLLGVLGVALVLQILEPMADARYITRNFYGVLRVVANEEENSLELLHGRISHGLQFQDSSMAWIPTTYYTRESGIGIAIANHPRRDQGLRIGIVGLGVGTIAAYGQQKDTIRFYEINPAVLQLSEGQHPYFTYLKNCRGHVEIALGDARLTLEDELRRGKNQRFDVLAVDAFSSDAIPVHLLTREAFEVYVKHIRLPDGIIAVHLSNRYLNLFPVVHGYAEQAGLSEISIYADDNDEGGSSSDWILLSPSRTLFELPQFADAAAALDGVDNLRIRAWTDDYSNLISVLK